MKNLGKIIYIGGFEMPDGNAAAHRVSSNARALRALGYEIVFIGITKSLKEDCKRELECGSYNYSQTYPVGILAWFRYITCVRYYEDIIKQYPNTKAIICYNLPAVSLFLLSRFAKKEKIKIIADCTEWYEVSKSDSFFKRIVKYYDIYFRMHKIHFKMDSIIVISRYLEDFYKNKGVKVINIPPLTNTEDNKWKQGYIEIKEVDEIEVSYVGSPFAMGSKTSKDRLDHLVYFFSYFEKRKVKLNVVGITENEFFSFYPDYFHNNLNESVIFHGRKTHLEALDILKRSDFSIFLRDESLTTMAGFPTKFVESMTAGVPVLTNKSSNLSDFLVEGENGFWLDNSSYDTLSESLEIALNVEPRYLQNMREKTYRAKLFDYRNYIEKFKYILE